MPATARALEYLYENEFKFLKRKAFASYKEKAFDKAPQQMERAFEVDPNQVDRGDRYDIACFYALAGDVDNSFRYLQMIADSKFDNYDFLIKDKDFTNLYTDVRWKELLAIVKQNRLNNGK